MKWTVAGLFSTWVNLVEWVCMLIFHSRISDPPNSSLLPAKIAIVRFGFLYTRRKIYNLFVQSIPHLILFLFAFNSLPQP